ncbi:MAG: response regulator [Acidobacteria bacterium]|nr:response regulator [Acidobacteriota bacterium]
MQVLVVDDSRAMRLILTRMLHEFGFTVTEAVDGRDALGRLRPDMRLVLVDWNMPEMNGLEFVQQMRRDAQYAGTKVMMVTTETEMGQVTRALEAGAQEYVMKPFTREVMLDKLRVLGLAA